MRRQRGFNLIEVLIALLLVLLGLTGAARLQATLLAASAEAKARDEATALALQQLASFQGLASYADYSAGLTTGSTQQQGLLHTYSLEWDVTHSTAPDYKTVTLIVRWPADEPTHNVSIQGLISGIEVGRFARQQLQP